MRVVIDTNVIVSALVTRSGNPARVVEAALAGEITPVMDSRTIGEARTVLARPVFATKHGVDPAWSQYVLDALEDCGIMLETVPPYSGSLPDEPDRPLVEVALAAGATLVTGNTRHFPAETGVVVFTPTEPGVRTANANMPCYFHMAKSPMRSAVDFPLLRHPLMLEATRAHRDLVDGPLSGSRVRRRRHR